MSEMTEPRSLPGGFQAWPQAKHFNNWIPLPAAPRVYNNGVCGAQSLAGAPPPARGYASGEGDGCANRRQSTTLCVTAPLPGRTTATARGQEASWRVAGGLPWGWPHAGPGRSEFRLPTAPGRGVGADPSPLTAAEGGAAQLIDPGTPEEPTQKVPGSAQKPRLLAKAPRASLGLGVCQAPSAPVPAAAGGSSFGRGREPSWRKGCWNGGAMGGRGTALGEV